VLTCTTANGGKLYKWIDDHGNVSYQDSPPPDNAKLLEEKTITQRAKPNGSTPQHPDVVIYRVDNCDLCDLIQSKMQKWGVPVQSKSLQDRQTQARIIALTNGLRAPSLFIGDNLITNLSDHHLLNELRAAGYQPKQADADDPNELP
jgi:glutaredoxin